MKKQTANSILKKETVFFQKLGLNSSESKNQAIAVAKIVKPHMLVFIVDTEIDADERKMYGVVKVTSENAGILPGFQGIEYET